MSTRPENEYRSFFGNLRASEDENNRNDDIEIEKKSVIQILQRLGKTKLVLFLVGYGIFTILVVGGVTLCLFVCLGRNEHQHDQDAVHQIGDSSHKQTRNIQEPKAYLNTGHVIKQRKSGLLLGFSKFNINSSSLSDSNDVIRFALRSESPHGPHIDYDVEKGIFTATTSGIHDIMLSVNIDTYSKDPHQDITSAYFWLRSTCRATGFVDYTMSKWRIGKRTTQTLTLYNIYYLNVGDTLQVGVNDKRFIYNDKSVNYMIIRVFS